MHIIRGIHLGQVTDVDPAQYKARVIFPNMAHVEGIMVTLGGQRQHPVAGEFRLPEPGDWGIIAFWTEDPRSGVWITSIPDIGRNIIPTELFIDDQHAQLRHTPGDQYAIEHGDGSLESVWPDGSMVRVTTSKDGASGNPAGSIARTERLRTLAPALGREPERLPLAPAPRGPIDIVLDHSSGARVRITADGSFKMTTPKGHAFTLHDATEKARDPNDPATVTSTPEEDADRIASEVVLESEMGLRVTLHDDPILGLARYVEIEHPVGHKVTLMEDPTPQADVRITVESGGGHKITMRDLPAADKHIKIETPLGHEVELRETPLPFARVKTVGGRIVMLDDDAAETTVTDPVKVTINAPLVDVGTDTVILGAGTAAIAREGDTVTVTTSTTVDGTAYAGTGTGTITSGSPKVSG